MDRRPTLIPDDDTVCRDFAMSVSISPRIGRDDGERRGEEANSNQQHDNIQSPELAEKPAVQIIPMIDVPFGDSDDEAEEILDDQGNDQEEEVVDEIFDTLFHMRQYPQTEDVQERACAALWVQSYDDENAQAMGRVGGISPVLDAMFQFPLNPSIQHSCCEIIQNLAVHAANRHVIVQKGGAALVVRAMMTHLNNSNSTTSTTLQISACHALFNLSRSKNLHKDILGAGASHAIVHAARSCASDTMLQQAALSALQELGADEAKQYLP